MCEVGSRNVPRYCHFNAETHFIQKEIALIGLVHYFDIKNQCKNIHTAESSLCGYPDTTVKLGDHVQNMDQHSHMLALVCI